MTIQTQVTAVRTTLATELRTSGSDSLRLINATIVAGARTTSLSLRAASISVETLNAGLGYALEHTPKSYEETKQSLRDTFDSLFANIDEEIAAEEAQSAS